MKTLILILLVVSATARAEEQARLSFVEVWAGARKSDAGLVAAGAEAEAARIGAERAGRHFYPRLMAGARAFSTNDPAASFVSILRQRAIGAQDFAPDTLNRPGSQTFESGFLGVDLPLFEGGAPSAQARVLESQRASREWQQKAETLALYSELAGEYAGLIVSEEEDAAVSRFLREVETVLGSYSIGTEANPVGYSGLLGLKALKNRLEGMRIQSALRFKAGLTRISRSVRPLPSDWRPLSLSLKEFLSSTLPLPKEAKASGAPYPVLALRSSVEAAEELGTIQRARHLPRVGLFAEGNLAGGSRDWATGYTAGAYLSWELFNATEMGAVAQARSGAVAAQARLEDLSRRTEAERDTSLQSAAALQRALELVENSTSLLDAQITTARKLFKNGTISALQLVEVFGRRADLIQARAETGRNLISAHLGAVRTSEGAPYEK